MEQAFEILKNGHSDFAILQCTSGYPADYKELNIRVIETYRDLFPDTVIGFSSHENGVGMPLLAYALGARIIEKHFTINRTMKGTDQAFSLSPSGLTRLCRDLERAHVALGDGVKRVYDSEIQPMKKQRKSIVAARELPQGHILASDDLAFKVPNEGLLPSDCHLLIGKAINRAIKTDDYIMLSDVG